MRGTAVNGLKAAQSGVRWRQQAINGVDEGFRWHSDEEVGVSTIINQITMLYRLFKETNHR